MSSSLPFAWALFVLAALACQSEAAPEAAAAAQPPAGVDISGTALFGDAMIPYPDARIEVLGPYKRAVNTDADGNFVVQAPAGPVFLRATRQGYFPTEVGAIAPATGVQIAVMDHKGVVEGPAMLGASYDPTKGIVLVYLDDAGSASSYGVHLSAAHGPSMSTDALDKVIPGEQTASGNTVKFVVFFNVDAGNMDILLEAPAGMSCKLDVPLPHYRVDPGTMTRVNGTCRPTR